MLGYRTYQLNSQPMVTTETMNSPINSSYLNTSLITSGTGNCAQFQSWNPAITGSLCRVSSGQVQNYYAVCEYVGGDTSTNQQCIFPFR